MAPRKRRSRQYLVQVCGELRRRSRNGGAHIVNRLRSRRKPEAISRRDPTVIQNIRPPFSVTCVCMCVHSACINIPYTLDPLALQRPTLHIQTYRHAYVDSFLDVTIGRNYTFIQILCIYLKTNHSIFEYFLWCNVTWSYIFIKVYSFNADICIPLYILCSLEILIFLSFFFWPSFFPYRV